MKRGQVHAAVVGECDPALRALLDEVLGELGVCLDSELRVLTPDVVLAPVTQADMADVLIAARSLAGRAPIVTILAMSDERLVARAANAGIASYSMDTPLERLRAVLVEALGERLALARGSG